MSPPEGFGRDGAWTRRSTLPDGRCVVGLGCERVTSEVVVSGNEIVEVVGAQLFET